jgi:hypothetical protein
MRVRDLDGYGVEIGRVVKAALITIATRMGDWRRLRFSTGLQIQGGATAWLQVFFFNAARLQCRSQAIIREFADADLANGCRASRSPCYAMVR